MQDFWKLVDQARSGNSPKTPSASDEAMKRVLQGLSNDEVANFGKQFYLKLIELNHWDLWAAGYILAQGMGDDAFHYFRAWVIGKGEACFQVALTDPGSLGRFIDDGNEELFLVLENESLEYTAMEVLEARGINRDPRDEVDGDADFDDTDGEPFDEETVEERFPQLVEFQRGERIYP